MSYYVHNDGHRAICGWLAVVALLAGCSNGGRLPTYPVTGRVVFPDGAPLLGGWIICESPEHAVAARGVIEADGTFELETYEPADGAVAGRHLVAVTPAAPEGYDPDQGTAPPAIDQRFTHMDTSGLEIEVLPDQDNHFELLVESPRR